MAREQPEKEEAMAALAGTHACMHACIGLGTCMSVLLPAALSRGSLFLCVIVGSFRGPVPLSVSVHGSRNFEVEGG